MSSREDSGRYRGRRRAPTPPRSRYAAVVTTAFVGAGIVALGAAHSVHDTKIDPAALSANINDADRQAAANRADRGTDRVDLLAAQSVGPWLAPLADYKVTTPFANGDSHLHPGVDLAAKAGTPYYAVHSGTVKLARAYGGYGYAVVLDLGDGTTVLYAHSSKLFVSEGQQVMAGEVLGLSGDSGYAFGDGLYLEVRVHDKAVEPTSFLVQQGVDMEDEAASAAG